MLCCGTRGGEHRPWAPLVLTPAATCVGCRGQLWLLSTLGSVLVQRDAMAIGSRTQHLGTVPPFLPRFTPSAVPGGDDTEQRGSLRSAPLG